MAQTYTCQQGLLLAQGWQAKLLPQIPISKLRDAGGKWIVNHIWLTPLCARVWWCWIQVDVCTQCATIVSNVGDCNLEGESSHSWYLAAAPRHIKNLMHTETTTFVGGYSSCSEIQESNLAPHKCVMALLSIFWHDRYRSPKGPLAATTPARELSRRTYLKEHTYL